MNIDNFEFEINLALDTKDEEWFNELITKRKEQLIHIEIPLSKIKTTTKYPARAIALDTLQNNACYISTDEGIRMPSNLNDLEDWVFVRVNKGDNLDTKIAKFEEVEFEYLTDAEDYCYKLYYKGYFLGFENSYNYNYSVFEKENKKLKDNNKLQSQVLKNYETELKGFKEFNNNLSNKIIELNSQIHILNKKLNWWKFWKRK